MKATLLLADAAHAVGGKLYILGGGWSIITVGGAYAIALKVEVPYDKATRAHELRLELLDADGHAVCISPTNGEVVDEGEPVAITGTFSTGIPAGIKAGTPLDVVLAFPVGPLMLEPNARYEWRLTIDGEADVHWCVAFSTRTAPPQALAA